MRRAITRRGLPEVLYADNGAPFSNAWLTRTCGVLGVRLVHSKPYSPEGRGKQERLNRYIREAFLAEATHRGIELPRRAERSVRRLGRTGLPTAGVHKETKEAPIDRFERTGPHRQADESHCDAFRWSTTRKVTRTATVSLEGNHYSVDPSLVARQDRAAL